MHSFNSKNELFICLLIGTGQNPKSAYGDVTDGKNCRGEN